MERSSHTSKSKAFSPIASNSMAPPQYHAWTLGVWEFPLLVDGTKYIAMIDCNEQIASYWRVKESPHAPHLLARDDES